MKPLWRNVAVLCLIVFFWPISLGYFGWREYTKGREEGQKEGYDSGYQKCTEDNKESYLKSIKLMDKAIESLNKKELEIARLEQLNDAYERQRQKDHPVRKVPIPLPERKVPINEQKSKRDD